MGLNDRPSGERVHISFFGLRNAGKSSVVNAVTGQALSLVSQVKGTTTDPVQKAMELLPIGPVVIIDTPGIDDVGGLGQLRVQRALQVLDKTDVAILVVDGTLGMQPDDRQLTEQFQTRNIPYLVVYNKADLLDAPLACQPNEIAVSAKTGQNIYELKERIGTVICPLGVGEHFEYWGFDPAKIVELDWHEQQTLGDGFTVRCLPSRHFSGRGRSSNQTLWGSFLLQSPSRKIYMGGDGGYGKHFAQIGREFPDIDLAVLENGQYNEAWRYIHTLPGQLAQAAKDLGAREILTVHHSKYALARHRWDEPLKTEAALAADTALHVLRPEIGEAVPLAAPGPAASR